jgi:hypothetical protein
MWAHWMSDPPVANLRSLARTFVPQPPLRFLIDHSEVASQAVGDTYEEMLSYLDELNPNRLDRRRRDFWADEGGVIELRTELLAGYRLGKGGVCFEFN